MDNIYNQWDCVLDLILKNSGSNDLVESCCGTMKLDEIKEFIFALDKRDGLLLGVAPDVQDNSEDDTISNFDPDSDTETEDDSIDGDNDLMEQDVDVDEDEIDPSTVVAEAGVEVVVDGLCSNDDFMEGGHIYTSDRTAQICISSLSGNSEYETDIEVDDE